MHRKNVCLCLILIIFVFMISCQNSATIKDSENESVSPFAKNLSVTPAMKSTKELASSFTNTEKQKTESTKQHKAENKKQQKVESTKTFIDHVSAIYMKDSKAGWALRWNGSLIATNNAWNSYKQIFKFKYFNKDAFHPSISYAGGTIMVFGYFTKNNGIVDVYQLSEKGNKQGIGHITDPDIKKYCGGDIFSSFIDDENGYVLCCGTPCIGQMSKFLFKTTDGGKTFQKVADISKIEGYPTGLSFSKIGKGYITCTYHGKDKAYLYYSGNKGKLWHTLTIKPPKNISYAYINAYPPCFIGKNGFIILEYVNHEEVYPRYIIYNSSDVGKHWKEYRNIKLQSDTISRVSFGDKNTLYIVNDAGELQRVVNGNTTAKALLQKSMNSSSDKALFNTALMKWLQRTTKIPIYLPDRWEPIKRHKQKYYLEAAGDMNSYGFDVYRTKKYVKFNDKKNLLDINGPVSEADFVGSINAQKDNHKKISLKVKKGAQCFALLPKITAYKTEDGCTVWWEEKGWNFSFVGANDNQMLKSLAGEWLNSDIRVSKTGEVKIIEGNRVTLYYSWKKDGYRYEFVSHDTDFNNTVRILNSFKMVDAGSKY